MRRSAAAAALLCAALALAHAHALWTGTAGTTAGTTEALRGRALAPVLLGDQCSARAGGALSWTVCARARAARSVRGDAVHVASARVLPGLLRARAADEGAIVLFYGRRCRFSARLVPTFAAVAARIPTCALAVEAVQLPALGAAFGVHGLPTVLYLHPARDNARYAGDRSFGDLLQWALNVTDGVRVPRRVASDAAPLLDLSASAGAPDWALACSVAVCVGAAALWAREWRRKREAAARAAAGADGRAYPR